MWRRRLTFPWPWGWHRAVIVRKEANRVKIRPGGAPTHRASVGYRSRDLSDPSNTDGGEAAAMTRGRRAAFRKSMWRKKGQEKSKDPWVALNKRKVFSFQSNNNHQTTTFTALTSQQVHKKVLLFLPCVDECVTFGIFILPSSAAPTLRK